MADDFNLGMDMPDADVDASFPVDTLREESAGDDALQAPESTLEAFAEQIEEEQIKPDAQGKAAPGWLNKRIEAGVEKRLKPILAGLDARVDAGIKAATAPFMAQMEAVRASSIEREAQALVDAGEIKSLEIAKAYVSQKYGAVSPTVPAPEPKPLAPDKTQPVDPRTDILAKQTMKLKAKGIDVFSTYKDNPAVREKVNSGEWDMHDVADYMAQVSTGRIPAPMRTANAGGIPKVTPGTMKDDQLDKFDTALQNGAKFSFPRGNNPR